MLFGFAIGCYLFLGGLAGGLGAFASWAGLRVPSSEVLCCIGGAHRRLVGVPLAVAAALTAASMLCLLADAARPEAVGALLTSPRANILTVGAWLLAAFGAACFGLALKWLRGRAVRHHRLLAVVHLGTIALGLAVAAYSAVYLAGIRAVPLWHSWWLVPLFVGSSFGAAGVLFAAMAYGNRVDGIFPAALRRVRVFAFACVVIEAVSALGFALTALGASAQGSGAAAVSGALQLLTGPDAFIWWGGFVVVGVAGAALFDLAAKGRRADRRMLRAFTLAACACALVGTFSLRMSVMMAGVHPVLGF